MHDALLVDEVHPVDDLQHVFDHLSLRQLKVLVDDPLEELAARDPTGQTHRVTMTTHRRRYRSGCRRSTTVVTMATASSAFKLQTAEVSFSFLVFHHCDRSSAAASEREESRDQGLLDSN